MAWARVTWPWLVGTLAVLLLLVAAAPAGAHVHGTQDARRTAASRQVTVVLTLRRGIAWQRSTTLGYQHAMHRWRWPAHYRERTVHSLVRLRHLAAMWNTRRQAAYRRYVRWAAVQRQAAAARARAVAVQARAATSGSDMGAWLCIHSHEGSWSDGGAPYYGGLQMDIGFQQSYGAEFLARWGTADHWPVWAQITAARRARDSGRGYGPWPNTARMCGLL